MFRLHHSAVELNGPRGTCPAFARRHFTQPLPWPSACVDVWGFQGRPGALPSDLAHCLNAEEQERARRFVKPMHGRRFSAFRAILRHLLAAYLDTAPGDIRLMKGERGKPALDPARHGTALFFNVSHSEESALFAFTAVSEVGVDIEVTGAHRFADLAGLATRVLSPEEQVYLDGLPTEYRNADFLDLWTVKEATLKAGGEGLSGYPAAIPALDVIRHEHDRWECAPGRAYLRWRLSPGAGQSAALALLLR